MTAGTYSTDSPLVRSLRAHYAGGGALTDDAIREARKAGLALAYGGRTLLLSSDALTLARIMDAYYQGEA